MNIITAKTTYATFEGAERKLAKETGRTLDQLRSSGAELRYLIAATPEGRFVPTVVGNDYVYLAHRGIMVVS